MSHHKLYRGMLPGSKITGMKGKPPKIDTGCCLLMAGRWQTLKKHGLNNEISILTWT